MASLSPTSYAILESDHSQESGHTGAVMATPSQKPRAGRIPDREIEVKYESIRNPCVLSWTDLSYTVKGKKTPELPWGTKTILDRVSGRCAPGELTAIMGPSGSGKTTLVDLLADRISSGDVSGVIEVNGTERNTKTFRAVTSYVAQEDTLLGSFTVVETMRMAAKLSLPNTVTSHEIEIRVENVMDAMGLETARDTLVGDIFRKGLSGGQKRRLSIAIELLSNPSILILDEPTSGLDSSAAHNVMKFIVKLCAEGKTVVCTIHQPSSLVYEMFTNVVVLSAGQTVYCGPRSKMISYFASSGYDCPQYMNPAEYFISLVNTDFEDHAEVPKLKRDRSTLKHLPDIRKRPPSSLRQFGVLMYRNTLNNIRNPGIYWIRLFMYFCLSFMAFLVFMSVAVLPFFIEQRTVFARERANSSLSVVSYVCANFLATLPGIFLIAVMSTALVVLLAGLNAFEYFLLNLFLSLVVSESMMHVIGAAVPHYIIGIALGAGVFGMFMLCEGFMVPRDSIPDYWIWGYYLAFHSYSFESFVFKQFENESSEEAQIILKKYGMENVDVSRDMLLLIVYIVGFQAIFAFILWKFHTGRR
ncbi:ABC transporter G family member 15 [Phytophthora cinnamomi]|uniref:ABC transporter G family member 15 n=1 Tax=Phytophthora cinnamomi TaxID=4785 RepID=UPI00355A30C6|nr:ABC transporter G family member 15 [Phytophthora cinnamomi]